jgi:hypothetical protein
MPYEVPAALIGAGAALVGGIVGTAGTLLAGSAQHGRDMDQALKDEGRWRSRESALELTELVPSHVQDLDDDHRHSNSEPDDVGRERDQRIRRDTDRMSALTGDLPEPWRTRIAEGLHFLRRSEEMGFNYRGGGTHYQTRPAINREVASYLRFALGAFLRNEPEPPQVTQRWIEYRQAYEDSLDQLRWEFAQEIGEQDEERSIWLEKHPALAARLAAEDLPEYMGDE